MEVRRGDPPTTADLVVIGGGVLGAATAFYATRAGLRTVVIERRPLLCTLTTPVAAGGFRLQFDNPEETELVRESLTVFEHFSEITGLRGYDLRLQKQGYLFVTTRQDTARRQAERVAEQRAWGVTDVELLTGDEARYRFPYLAPEIISARFRAGDGFLDPKRLTYGYALASSATFVLDTAVTGFTLAAGRLARVETSRGSISTPAAVIAAGPFSGPLARLAGIDPGFTTVRRHRLTMPEVPEVPPDAPFVIDEDNGAHWRPAYQGAYLVFTDPTTPPSEPAWDVPSSSDFVFQLLDPTSEHAVAHACPFWRRVWERGSDHWILQAGQYTYTPDHRPFLGPTPVPGLYLNAGYSGHGIMGSAGGSRRVVDLILGRADPRLNPFRWDRPLTHRPFDVI
ncbi:MAG: FAD-binding oxidoreductase [Chloroflexi bacterium]|nr:FAD-binding oxidoreductase [Chloroflexota bacterium]